MINLVGSSDPDYGVSGIDEIVIPIVSDDLYDYGDAPAPYFSSKQSSGPRHLRSELYLGSSFGTEADALVSANADSDPSDDGIGMGVIRVGEGSADITVTVTGGTAKLDAWIDFDGDGAFGGPLERIFYSEIVEPGTQTLSFMVPTDARSGSTIGRFRLSSAGGLSPTGDAADGEVEDFQIQILPPVAGGYLTGNIFTIDADIISTVEVKSGDLDGDGDIDFVSASHTGSIQWFENLGSGLFDSHTLATQVYGIRAIQIADMNGDGFLDLLTVSDSLGIKWIANDGMGSFSTVHSIVDASGMLNAAAVDLDQDGYLDVVYTNYLSDSWGWFKNNRDGSFSFVSSHSAPSDPQALLVRDLDNDGDLDVVIGGLAQSHVELFRNNGTQSFESTYIPQYGTVGTFASIDSGDLDNDGDQDLVLSSLGSNQILWLENLGSSFATSNRILTSSTDATSVWSAKVIDMDGDGNLDIVSSDNTWNLNLLYGDSLGNFRNSVIIEDLLSSNFQVADFDNDGVLDLLTVTDTGFSIIQLGAADFGDAPPSYDANLIYGPAYHPLIGPTLGERRDGELRQPSVTLDGDDLHGLPDEDGVSFPDAITVGSANATALVNVQNTDVPVRLDAWIDFNNDGSFAGAEERIADGLLVHAGDNTVSFQVPAWATVGQRVSRFRISTDGVSRPHGAAVDGEIEDHLVNIINPPTSLGEFEDARGRVGSGRIVDLVSVDLDGDGDIDFVTAEENAINWYENIDGAGLLALPQSLATFNGSVAISVADINQDQLPDIVVARNDTGSGQLLYLENIGAMTFAFRDVLNSTALAGLTDVAVADIDGDGALDLITSSSVYDYVLWHHNRGPSGFGGNFFNSYLVSQQADGPSSVLVVDSDSDGDMDVIVTSTNDDAVTLFENDGSSVFSLANRWTTVDGADVVIATDLDSDSDLDFVFTSTDGGTVSWIRNDGAGIFQLPELIATVQNPKSIVAGDINGDGTTDLVVASIDQISTFRNDGAQAFTIAHVASFGSDFGPIALANVNDDSSLELAFARGDVPVLYVSRQYQYDFGDAPASYGTSYLADGARHRAMGPKLGSFRDSETGSAYGTGLNDDVVGEDDEDGVAVQHVVINQLQGNVEIVVSELAGKLDAWIDFNQDGMFDAAMEKIFDSVLLEVGNHNLVFPVPASALEGDTYARFRISSAGGLGPHGKAFDGEVEDYVVHLHYDNTPPTAEITLSQSLLTIANPSLLATLRFSEPVADLSIEDIVVNSTIIEKLDFTQVDDTTYTVELRARSGFSTSTGVVLQNTYNDLSGNQGESAAEIFQVDTLRPNVSIALSQTSLSTTLNSTTATFNFSEPVEEFDASDIVTDFGLPSSFNRVNSQTFTAFFTAASNLSGEYSIGVNAESYRDLSGNLGEAGTIPISIDTTQPVILGISVGSSLPIRTPNVDLVVDFSEPVFNFDSSDVVLTGAASQAAIVGTPVKETDTRYRVPVSGLRTGSLLVAIATEPGDIVDAEGLSVDPRNAEYSVVVPNLFPTSAIIVDANNNPFTPSAGQPFWVRVTYTYDDPANNSYTIGRVVNGQSEHTSPPVSFGAGFTGRTTWNHFFGSWVLYEGGTYQATVTLDNGQAVLESDETDNSITINFNVSGGVAPEYALVGAEEGRALLGDGTNVIVGTMDDAFDYNHPWFTGNDSLGRPRLVAELQNNNGVGGSPVNADHATAVMGVVLANGPNQGDIVGLAPDARFVTAEFNNRANHSQAEAVHVFDAAGFLVENGAEVINMSWSWWSGSNTESYTGETSSTGLMADYLAYAHNIVAVPAVNQLSNHAFPTAPGSSRNVITVGGLNEAMTRAWDQQDHGPTPDGRSKPDLIGGTAVNSVSTRSAWRDGRYATGSAGGTSLAAPFVTGAAAQMIDYGKSNGESIDHRVIKAVLMNSGVKTLDDNGSAWSNSPTRPLDDQQGTGVLNLPRVFEMYSSGQQSPGEVGSTGYDFATIAGTDNDTGVMIYQLGSPTSSGILDITLAWDRPTFWNDANGNGRIDAADSFFTDPNDGQDNLDLLLYRDGILVANSVSTVDTVEHLHVTNLPSGQYELHVVRRDVTGTGNNADYGLAWHSSADWEHPSPPSVTEFNPVSGTTLIREYQTPVSLRVTIDTPVSTPTLTDLLISGSAVNSETSVGNPSVISFSSNGPGTYEFPIYNLGTGTLIVAIGGESTSIVNDNGLQLIELGAVYNIVTLADFGDAPASYLTSFDDDGPRHYPTGPQLGSLRDTEQDAFLSLDASGDGDDEDGVTLANFVAGSTAIIYVDVQNEGGQLSAWFDFNRDGSFSAAENFLVNESVPVGIQAFEINVPIDASLGNSFARFRISRNSVSGPSGLATSGEVEDYQITITDNSPPTISVLGSSYTEGENGGQPIQLQPLGSVTDDDGDADWRLGASLSVQLTDGMEATDELSILSGAVGNITFANGEIRDGGSIIATVDPPSGIATEAQSLTIRFNDNSNQELVQQVLRSIGYRSTTSNPSSLTRSVTYLVSDARGSSSSSTQPLVVTPVLSEDITLDTEAVTNVDVSRGWGSSTSVNGFEGNYYLFAKAGTGATVTFTPPLEIDGRYEVFLSSTAHNNRASNAPVRIVHKDGTTATTVNQRTLNGFQSLGTFNFLTGTTGHVSITARDANGIVVADAVRFVRIGDLIEAPTVDLASPTSGSTITNVAINAAGKLQVTFQSVAGINPASIIDAAPEIALSGPGAVGVTLSGTGVLVIDNTYEYSFTGEFVPGLVKVDFIAESFADVTGSLNAAENESFTVTDTVVRIELDNSDATQQFAWATSGSVPGYIGTDYLYTNAGGAGRLTYTPTLPLDGAYEVFVTYTGGTSRASNAAYEVNSLAGTSVVRIDQRTGGGTFQSLGTFDFAAGTTGSVTLRASDANGVVVGDAMRFVRVGELAGAPSATLTDPEAGSTISLVSLNDRDYLDVTYQSNSAFGLNTESITDADAEFTLTGPGAVGVSVNGAATWVSGTTYRYATSGDFSPGAVDAVFAAGSYADLSPVPLTNQASIESFMVIESVTAEVIVDNSDAGFVVSDPEQFVTSSSVRGFIGDDYAAAAPGSTATATWTPTLAQAGTYEVFVRYTAHRLRATNATYVITHSLGTTEVPINQTENGGEWVSLGTYELPAGTAASVQLLTAGANNFVIADAVRFVLP